MWKRDFGEADVVTEGTFGYENIPNPLPPEAPGAVALWEEPNKVTLWVSNQASYMDKVTLFHVLNREVEVRTIGGTCGGSFGSKFMSWQVQCSRGAPEPGHREARQARSLPRKNTSPPSRCARVAHAGQGGHEEGRDRHSRPGTWLIDTGYYSMTTQSQVAVGCGEAQIMVRCPNWDLKPVIVCTNRNASGIVRGFWRPGAQMLLIPL